MNRVNSFMVSSILAQKVIQASTRISEAREIGLDETLEESVFYVTESEPELARPVILMMEANHDEALIWAEDLLEGIVDKKG